MTQKRDYTFVLFVIAVFLCTSYLVSAQTYVALQGNVLNSTGSALSSGNLRVVIFDSAVGGSEVYNSTTDFNGAIVSGKYDVLLGNGTNALNLEYGKQYYLAIFVNGENFSYNGSQRQLFQSSVGQINTSYVNQTSGSSWFGLTLDTILNLLGAKTAWTTSGNTIYNSSVTSVGIGTANPVQKLDVRGNVNVSGTIYIGNTTDISTFLYNQTTPAITYLNTTYGALWYNHTATAQAYAEANFLRIDGDNGTGRYQFDGGWQNGGVTIDQGNLYAQALFVYNITSLQVSHLNTNGSFIPIFNNTFSLGNATRAWSEGHFATDAYVSGIAVKQWLYNQTTPAITYLNTTYGALWYNHTTVANTTIFNTYDQRWSSTFNQSYDSKQSLWATNGTAITNLTVSQVGIGTSTPNSLLNVVGEGGLATFGSGATATGNQSIALGKNSHAHGFGDFAAVGGFANSSNSGAPSIAFGGTALGSNSVAFSNSDAQDYSFAYGSASRASSLSIALGPSDAIAENESVALGYFTSARNSSSSLGRNVNTISNSLGFGRNLFVRDNSIAIGFDFSVNGSNSGGINLISGQNISVIGRNTFVLILNRNDSSNLTLTESDVFYMLGGSVGINPSVSGPVNSVTQALDVRGNVNVSGTVYIKNTTDISNIFGQNCPVGQMVNGTLSNGTLICVSISGGSGPWSVSGTTIYNSTVRRVNIGNGSLATGTVLFVNSSQVADRTLAHLTFRSENTPSADVTGLFVDIRANDGCAACIDVYGTNAQINVTASNNVYGSSVTIRADENTANSYGYFINYPTAGVPTRYGFYASGENYNYFSGKLGIGTVITPTYALHVGGNASINNTLFVMQNGRVGIGNSTPSYQFVVQGNASFNNTLFVNSNGSVRVGPSAGNDNAKETNDLYVAGDLEFDGNIFAGTSQGVTATASIIDDQANPCQLLFVNGILTSSTCTGGCFLPGTKITLADGTLKNIEDVRVNETIRSYNRLNGDLVNVPVRAVMNKIVDAYYIMEFDDGSQIKVTDNHPLFTQEREWASINPNASKLENPNLVVEQLRVGDHVKRQYGWKQITGWMRVEGQVQVYNLNRVGLTAAFFADDTLAHNKCVQEGTLIATPLGLRAIETLAVGELVYGQDTFGTRVATPILRTFKKEMRDAIPGKILPNGEIVTWNHIIEIDGNKVLAGDTALQDTLITEPVYDLETVSGNYYVRDTLTWFGEFQ